MNPPPRQFCSQISSLDSWAFQLLKYLAKMGEGLGTKFAVPLQSQPPLQGNAVLSSVRMRAVNERCHTTRQHS